MDFEDPEATILVRFPSGDVDIQVNSILLRGRYFKRGRMISQAYWPTPEGPKYYSVEESLWGILKVTGGERVVVHAAGREDVDARMLGPGRPLIVEVKAPRRRPPLSEIEKAANQSPLVGFKVEGVARRRDIAYYKEEVGIKAKIYKALVAVKRDVTEEDIRRLESELTNRVILQRTPRRVLHRRRDVVRRKVVRSVKCLRLTSNVMECLIEAEGGLYIKELVSGDDGRTTPSFSELLSSESVCIELDVVSVVMGP